MKTRLIFAGGFLGAGKTTMLLQSAEYLKRQGLRVAVITNDQGSELVDTLLARQHGTPVTEVTGGCFCCRLYDFVEAVQLVTKTVQPDIILAEPTGSCTDIMATVVKPLERDYGDCYDIAPFTVLADPLRDFSGFTAPMADLFRWQIAEAEILVVSKADLYAEADLDWHIQSYRQAFPDKKIMSLSSRTGMGMPEWIAAVLHPARLPRNVIPVDYLVYTEAEAALGWLNATLRLRGDKPFSPGTWAADFLTYLKQDLQTSGTEIAHIKLYAYAKMPVFKASLTGVGRAIDWDFNSVALVDEAAVTVNARVCCEPHILSDAVERAAQNAAVNAGLSAEFDHIECFSPSPPQPVFRMS